MKFMKPYFNNNYYPNFYVTLHEFFFFCNRMAFFCFAPIKAQNTACFSKGINCLFVVPSKLTQFAIIKNVRCMYLTDCYGKHENGNDVCYFYLAQLYNISDVNLKSVRTIQAIKMEAPTPSRNFA